MTELKEYQIRMMKRLTEWETGKQANNCFAVRKLVYSKRAMKMET